MIFNDGYSVYAFPGIKESTVRQIEIGDVITITSDYLSIPVSDIMSKCRKREIVTARHLCMFFARYKLSKPTAEIGRYFNVDHTSVLHACTNVSNWKETDENFYRAFKQIKTEIKRL